jgi:O-antigen ligase
MTVLYLGAFWNAEGLMGFPAQALKTAIAPNEVGSKDQSSDGYRQVENLDLLATIQAKPVTGLGFGHQFYRPYPLPDISFFPFYQYMPHNSVLWVWIQTGVGGFIAMLFLFASGIRQGVRSMLKLPPGGDTVLVFAGLSFVIMYLVFAYVDVAWDARSMITLAVSMAVCSEILRLPADEPHVPRSKPSRLHATVAGRPERRLTAVTP